MENLRNQQTAQDEHKICHECLISPVPSKQWSALYELDTLDLEKVPTGSGIYEIRTDRAFGRIRGECTLLYVGKTKDDLQGRLRVHQSTVLKGMSWRTGQPEADKIWYASRFYRIFVRWVIENNFAELESKLILGAEDIHGELPPANSRREIEVKK